MEEESCCSKLELRPCAHAKQVNKIRELAQRLGMTAVVRAIVVVSCCCWFWCGCECECGCGVWVWGVGCGYGYAHCVSK